MSAKPIPVRETRSELRLAPFDAEWAATIASWVRSPGEAFWLAPRTPPPLTAKAVCDWSGSGREAVLLFRDREPCPIAYGEINVLDRVRRSHWLGHLIVAPAERGQGLGRRLTEALLKRAFIQRQSLRVTLVVFRENQPAIACYRGVGLRPDGYEYHYFEPYQRGARLLRMALNVGRYQPQTTPTAIDLPD